MSTPTTTTETRTTPAPWLALTERAAFLVDNLNLEEATGVEGARWEGFQLLHLCDDGPFRIEDKSRQIAWSWLAAAEAAADAILDKRDAIFVSINQEEAKEKIRYARRVYESLARSVGGLPTLIRDNELGLELSNGARLSSLPAKAPRGRARANVYLDEFAHVQRDRPIYTAALPVISKGGRLRIGSSPLGASGVFWEVYSQKLRPYPGYTRNLTPWWAVYSFCQDVPAARQAAPTLTSLERVEQFGNVRIRAIFDNMPLEDFQQEYEGAFVDESTAWITWEEIRAAQDPDLDCTLIAIQPGGDIGPAVDAINRLAYRAQRGMGVEQAYTAGLDIGRTRNTSELYVIGLSTVGSYPLRLAISMDGMTFDDQAQIVDHALSTLPLVKMYIDRNGIGMSLAEGAQAKHPAKAKGVAFTGPSKILWATDAKQLIQQGRTPIPADRDLAYQIHSVKRIVSPSKNLIFDTDRNEKHHADRFWAWALALAATRESAGLSDEELAAAFGYL